MSDDNCMGCRSFKAFSANRNSIECLYTEPGATSLTNCPCKICLVKVMCKKKCNLFNAHLDRITKPSSIFSIINKALDLKKEE
jgi:hypothetical protein